MRACCPPDRRARQAVVVLIAAAGLAMLPATILSTAALGASMTGAATAATPTTSVTPTAAAPAATATPTAGPAKSSTTASATSSASASPTSTAPAGSDLAAEAKKIVDAGLKKYGEGYISRIDSARHIVYLSAADEQMLGRVMDILGSYADRQRQFLFPGALPWNMTVVLPTLDDYRRSLPAGLEKAMGFYHMPTRTLLTISLTDIVLHEFTHGLHHADQVQARQRHPLWISEGLATLFQGSKWRQKSLEPLTDPSLASLQQAVRDGKAHPLAKFVTLTPAAFAADDKLCYSEARYIMFYLYRLNKLKEFYDTYKAGYALDRSGSTALATTLGKPLDQVEADWRAWVLSQKAPWVPAVPQKTFLGVRTEETANGLKITAFVRGSAAEQSGLLKAGDIILSVDGHGTSATSDLASAVQACKPGEIIEIELSRAGRSMSVKQVLGATRP